MNLIKRLRNIWKLGGVELFPNGHYQTVDSITGESICHTLLKTEKPHMAEIIKRRDPVAEALKTEI